MALGSPPAGPGRNRPGNLRREALGADDQTQIEAMYSELRKKLGDGLFDSSREEGHRHVSRTGNLLRAGKDTRRLNRYSSIPMDPIEVTVRFDPQGQIYPAPIHLERTQLSGKIHRAPLDWR